MSGMRGWMAWLDGAAVHTLILEEYARHHAFEALEADESCGLLLLDLCDHVAQLVERGAALRRLARGRGVVMEDRKLKKRKFKMVENQNHSDAKLARMKEIVRQRLERQKQVNEIIADEMQEIHAFSMKTWTPQQYEAKKAKS